MLEKLIEIIHNYTGDDSIPINESTSFVGDLGLNSLDLVSMASEVEDEFEVEIPDRALKDIKTVGDVINFINLQSSKS